MATLRALHRKGRVLGQQTAEQRSINGRIIDEQDMRHELGLRRTQKYKWIFAFPCHFYTEFMHRSNKIPFFHADFAGAGFTLEYPGRMKQCNSRILAAISLQ